MRAGLTCGFRYRKFEVQNFVAEIDPSTFVSAPSSNFPFFFFFCNMNARTHGKSVKRMKKKKKRRKKKKRKRKEISSRSPSRASSVSYNPGRTKEREKDGERRSNGRLGVHLLARVCTKACARPVETKNSLCTRQRYRCKEVSIACAIVNV